MSCPGAYGVREYGGFTVHPRFDEFLGRIDHFNPSHRILQFGRDFNGLNLR